MSVFAISDTHLSFGTDKPMDSFPGWNDYVEKIEKNWNSIVTADDTVVVAGDISWAMNFDELVADFKFLDSLNGTKIIIKGNHDYWWNTARKMNNFISENGFETIKILFNNSYEADGISICGSRGWALDVEDEHDEKVLNREVGRLRLSLDSATNENKIVFLHYPPVTIDKQCDEIVDVLKEYGIKKCYYGHLHGIAARYAVDDVVDGIKFSLISCDKLGFTPKLIR